MRWLSRLFGHKRELEEVRCRSHVYWCEEVRKGRIPMENLIVKSPAYLDLIRRVREAPTLEDAVKVEWR
jgi:hypothetical protein